MRGRWLVAGACLAIGGVWIGQGTGLLQGSSFMVDDLRWALAGAAMVAIAAVLAVSAWRARASRRP
jgi:hypothetical protein